MPPVDGRLKPLLLVTVVLTYPSPSALKPFVVVVTVPFAGSAPVMVNSILSFNNV